jgi:hypothetical protein
MLSSLPTVDEILNYLRFSDLQSKYVCADGTLCNKFAGRIVPEKVSSQSTYGVGNPRRMWWVEYVNEFNKFVLRCSYFDGNNIPITREEFQTQLSNIFPVNKVTNMPAVLYTPQAVIQWLPSTENEWTVTFNVSTPTSGCLVTDEFSKILKIV